jgi:hypothetical protein
MAGNLTGCAILQRRRMEQYRASTKPEHILDKKLLEPPSLELGLLQGLVMLVMSAGQTQSLSSRLTALPAQLLCFFEMLLVPWQLHLVLLLRHPSPASSHCCHT